MILQKLPNGEMNPHWLKSRSGCLSASRIADITKTARKKGEVSATLMTYAKQLAAERITGFSVNNVNPNNPDIMRGNEMEDLALAAYEIKTGTMLKHPAAWVEHPTIEHSGATPDSWTSDGGLVQVKCPRQDNFVSAVIDFKSGKAADVLKPYEQQMTWECAVTGTAYNDLALFCNDMPEGKRLLVIRHEPTREEIEALEIKAREFLKIVDHIFTTITTEDY